MDQSLSLQVYHPNIDLEGNVCLNILREDWKPVLSISSIIYGLQFLFLVRQRRPWACMESSLYVPAWLSPLCCTPDFCNTSGSHTPCTQDPNPDDPLNKQAAKMLQTDPRHFESIVRSSIMRGQHIDGTYFPPCKP